MDIRTFKNLQDDVLNWLDEAGDTDTTLTLAKQAINTAHKKRVTQEQWPFMLWNVPQTFTTVANQQLYALHSEFSRPSYFWNRTLLQPLVQYDNAQLFNAGLDWNNDSDSARRFLFRAPTLVQNQPTSASVLAVASSAGAGDASATVTITGETANGIDSETITSGTTGTKQFTFITKVRKDTVWAGTLTLTSNSGVVTVLTLFPAEAARSYPQLFLPALPPAGEVVEYMFYRGATRLAQDNDIPDIPGEFSELIVWDTLLDFAAYNQYDASVVGLWARRQAETLLLMQQTLDTKASGYRPDYINLISR